MYLRLLRQAAIVREHRSSADGRDVYYSLNFERFEQLYHLALGELHPALDPSQTQANPQPASADRPATRVLFLCTHNSARSQLAEALLRQLGGERVEAHSAGTEPARVHPVALATLENFGVNASGLSSKHLQQFIGQHFDYVITVCDRAKESCPVFPGDPERIHWSFPDPSAVADPAEQRRAFAQVFVELEKRIKLLLALIDGERAKA